MDVVRSKLDKKISLGQLGGTQRAGENRIASVLITATAII